MKKIISFVLTAVMLFSLLPLSAFAYIQGTNEVETDDQGFEYELCYYLESSWESTEGKTAYYTITDYTGDAEELTLPSEYKGIPIIGIGVSAFSYNTTLKKITLSENIIEIERYAFSDCTALETVVLPKSLKIMNTSVFYECTSLDNVVLPEGIESIPSRCFYNCTSLKNITLPNTLKEITYQTFTGCTSLTNIVLPESLEIIDAEAFYDAGIVFNEYEYGKYLGSKDNPYFALCKISSDAGESFKMHADTKILADSFCHKNVKYITFSEHITALPETAFYGCNALETIDIPDTITGLGYKAFSKCTALKSITFGNSIKYIGSYAFSGCTALENITFGNSIELIGSYAFSECTALETVVLPDYALELDSHIFEKCTALKNVTLSKHMETLPQYMFSGCSALESIVIPDGTITILDRAFDDCTSLKNIDFGNTVTTISADAFIACDSLEEVYLPDSVTSIGSWAFSYCPNLKKIRIPDSIEAIGHEAFVRSEAIEYNEYEKGLYLGNENNPYVALMNGTSIDTPVVELHKDTKALASEAFLNNVIIEEITLNDSIKNIPRSIFEGCTNLKKVVLPEGIETIPVYAFKDCTSLKELDLPESLLGIGSYAFSNCAVEALELPDGILYIDEGGLARATALKSITIPEGILGFGLYPFRYCSSMTDIYCETEYEFYGEFWMEACDAVVHWNCNAASVEAAEDGALEKRTYIRVSELSPEETVITNDEIDFDIASVLDIRLTLDDAEVDPNGALEISIPAPEGLDIENSMVWMIGEDGTTTDMNAVYENGSFVFKTEALGVFALVSEDMAPDIPEEPTPESKPRLGDVDNDGDIDADDYIKLKRIFFGIARLSDLPDPENALYRCDITKSDDIDADDYIKLKRVYFGLYILEE